MIEHNRCADCSAFTEDELCDGCKPKHDAGFEIEEAIIEWLDTPPPSPVACGIEDDESRAVLVEKILKRLRDKGLLK